MKKDAFKAFKQGFYIGELQSIELTFKEIKNESFLSTSTKSKIENHFQTFLFKSTKPKNKKKVSNRFAKN